nr:MTRF1L release factor glutamine methyltransferase-like isoform X2 [Procambarus clarkii]
MLASVFVKPGTSVVTKVLHGGAVRYHRHAASADRFRMALGLPVYLQRLCTTVTHTLASLHYHCSICKQNLAKNMVSWKILIPVTQNHGGFHTYMPASLYKRITEQSCDPRPIPHKQISKSSHTLPQNCTRYSAAGRTGMKHHLTCSLHQSAIHTDLSHRAYSTCALTVKDTLIDWTGKLEAAQVPEACLAVEYIISYILGVSRELERHASVVLSEAELTEVDRLMTCRLARMPLQYILGEWDFHSVTLKMRPPVFIPRPETEQLVELALECLQGMKMPRILEIGCGSGAICISLLNCIHNLQCVALDHSKHAIELTQLNAANNKVSDRLLLVKGKVTREKMPSLPQDNFSLIISNPPYVLRKDLLNVQPEIMVYEDMRALDGGKEGLDVIKAILIHSRYLLPDGHSVILEVDPCHCHLIPAWLEKQPNLQLKLTEVFKDFNGKDRFIKLLKCAKHVKKNIFV